jgi:uncharacterized protein YggT (Ycf19 family)
MTDPFRREPGMVVYDPISRVRHVRTVRTGKYRAIHLVWFLAGVVDVVVGLRFLLKLLGASLAAPFVSLVYGISEPLIGPFRGIFPMSVRGAFVFEPAALVALAIYPLIAAGIVGMMRVTSGRAVTG